MPSFIPILVLGLAAATSAQQVLPSNDPIPPPASGRDQVLNVLGYQGRPIRVAPLTAPAGLGQNAGQIGQTNIPGPMQDSFGQLIDINADNINRVTSGMIAYIDCEPSGNQSEGRTPTDIVTMAARLRPAAILLYSTRSRSCAITGDFNYQTLYTMTNTEESAAVLRGNVSVQIKADSNGPNSNNNNFNNGGPAPTTAVAMSILYAITGIITLLFLVIISTGAIRAHRNPERYGPRRALGGRTRQSRAKGLARAMLETIPIVKFGDPEPVKAGSNRDIELADANTTRDTTPVPATDAEKTASSEVDSKSLTVPPPAVGAGMESGMGTAESIKSAGESTAKDDALECSICTEQFTTGEDVRVLPCHHKFHPACIDPWLLNVSGTCPLCRHDLNPYGEGEGETEATEGTELPPPLTPEPQPESDTTPHRRRVSRFLDFNRLRTAPPAERIAALRQLREESRAEGHETEEMQTVEEQGSSRQRLRDRLRIGGRSHPTTTPSPETTPPPTAPANETPR